MMTKHEAAYSVLKDLNKPSSYKDIHEQIKIRSLTTYKEGVDEAHITRNAIEKKCINSNLADYPKSEILFYRDEDGNYDLYEKLTEIEKKYYSQKNIEFDHLITDIENIKKSLNEVEQLKNNLHKNEIEILELKNSKMNNENFETNYGAFLKQYSKFDNQYSESSKILDEFTKNIKETEDLFEKLNNSKHALNINVFSKSFQKILELKNEEKKNQKFFLVSFGFLIILVPVLSLFIDISNNYYKLIPIVTIEVFLVYYFKLFLHNFNSLKEQILQIETKVSLLEFISGYMDFKIKNKIEQDEINKFEEIIFSKISPNMKTIPTSPDVISLIEKVAKVISKSK